MSKLPLVAEKLKKHLSLYQCSYPVQGLKPSALKCVNIQDDDVFRQAVLDRHQALKLAGDYIAAIADELKANGLKRQNIMLANSMSFLARTVSIDPLDEDDDEELKVEDAGQLRWMSLRWKKEKEESWFSTSSDF
ncbi:hypothetical protein ACLB2K_040795 [Fragaria x ananassa]